MSTRCYLTSRSPCAAFLVDRFLHFPSRAKTSERGSAGGQHLRRSAGEFCDVATAGLAVALASRSDSRQVPDPTAAFCFRPWTGHHRRCVVHLPVHKAEIQAVRDAVAVSPARGPFTTEREVVSVFSTFISYFSRRTKGRGCTQQPRARALSLALQLDIVYSPKVRSLVDALGHRCPSGLLSKRAIEMTGAASSPWTIERTRKPTARRPREPRWSDTFLLP